MYIMYIYNVCVSGHSFTKALRLAEEFSGQQI